MVGDKLIFGAGAWTLVTNVAHHHSGCLGGRMLIGENTRIDGIFTVELDFAIAGDLHQVFGAAEEVNARSLLPLIPLSHVGAGAVPNIKHLAPLGRSLAQLPGTHPFERMHVVLAFLAPTLKVCRGQMRQGMRAIVQRVKMPDRTALTFDRCIVDSGGMVMAVASVNVDSPPALQVYRSNCPDAKASNLPESC